MDKVVKDIWGKEIKIGDTVTYDHGSKQSKVTVVYPEYNSVDVVTGQHFGEVTDSFNIKDHQVEKIE